MRECNVLFGDSDNMGVLTITMYKHRFSRMVQFPLWTETLMETRKHMVLACTSSYWLHFLKFYAIEQTAKSMPLYFNVSDSQNLSSLLSLS